MSKKDTTTFKNHLGQAYAKEASYKPKSSSNISQGKTLDRLMEEQNDQDVIQIKKNNTQKTAPIKAKPQNVKKTKPLSKQKLNGFIRETEKTLDLSKEDRRGSRKTLNLLYGLPNQQVKTLLHELAGDEIKQVLGVLQEDLFSQNNHAIRIEKLIQDVIEEKKSQRNAINTEGFEDLYLPPFNFFITLTKPQQLALLESESPRIIAIIFSQLEGKLSAQLLMGFSATLQKEIIVCLKKPFKVSKDILRRIELRLKEKSENLDEAEEMIELQGEDILTQILKNMPYQEEHRLLAGLSDDAELSERLRNRVFSLDILTKIPERTLADYFTTVEDDVLAYILHENKDYLINVLENTLTLRRYRVIDESLSLDMVDLSQKEAALTMLLQDLRSKINTGEISLAHDDLIE